jgi:hypothetical protein
MLNCTQAVSKNWKIALVTQMTSPLNSLSEKKWEKDVNIHHVKHFWCAFVNCKFRAILLLGETCNLRSGEKIDKLT